VRLYDTIVNHQESLRITHYLEHPVNLLHGALIMPFDKKFKFSVLHDSALFIKAHTPVRFSDGI